MPLKCITICQFINAGVDNIVETSIRKFGKYPMEKSHLLPLGLHQKHVKMHCLMI